MMKRKIFAISLVAVSLLTSCGRRQLRGDIANYIASFSYERSLETYQEAKYNKETIKVENGVNTRTTEEFYFNKKDANNLQYHKYQKIYENDILTHEYNEDIIKRSEEYYFVKDEVEVLKTSSECLDIMNKFFYTTESSIDSKAYGMYYGDLIYEIIYDVQDFVSIEEDKYVYRVVQYLNNNGQTGFIKISYTVNNFGMLESYHYEGETGENTINTTINVVKL